MLKKSRPINALAVLLTLLVAVQNFAVTPANPQLPDPGSTGMTKEQQEQAGRQVMAEVYKQMPVLPDSSPETQYIQQLGKKLVDVIPPQYSWPYEFHVIPQKEINAFALPGGPMFVNVGTIAAADNEAELAGVMAHEMSHVYMQHSAKQASKAQWANLLGALGSLFGSGVGGTLARLGIQLGAGTLMMRYSRGDEAQADAVGAIIMYKAGYNPRALADFFEKLEKQRNGNGPQFLSDHPNPGNRREAIDREIRDWPPKTFAGNSDAFLRAKQHAMTVKTYTGQQIADEAKQGIWEQTNRQTGATPTMTGSVKATETGALANITFEQVRPSSDVTSLQQDAFTISYPENWHVFGGQQATMTIAPPAGVTQGAIGYGVVIALAQDQNANSLDEFTSDLVTNLQQSNSGLRQSGNSQRIQVSGQQADSVSLAGTSPVEQNGRRLPERDWLVTFQRQEGGFLYLIFIAPESDFERLRPAYQRMLDSLEIR
ncbi:MAG: M48 family metalloprotease [Terriglobales bacterium]|jgi:hypothetical protein